MSTYLNGGIRPPTCNPSEIQVFWKDRGKACSGSICDTSKDENARRAYQTIKAALDFFNKNYDLCGIDGKGTVPKMYIDWQENNAQSNCSSTGKASDCFLLFDNRYLTPEVIVHEYTHSVVARNSPLNQCGEPGALNESISDVMGIAFKHYQSDVKLMTLMEPWAMHPISRDISKHVTMRDYQNDGFCSNKNDQNHIHANSRIPSHAFFVAVQESKTTAYGEMSRIWFQAMLMSDRDETFKGFALKTLVIARDRFSNHDRIVGSLVKSWHHVGVIKPQVGNRLHYTEAPYVGRGRDPHLRRYTMRH